MITVRKADDRAMTRIGWLDGRHTFSFGRSILSNDVPYADGFRSLLVVNDDRVRPGMGFSEHPHDNMEIITYVLDGQLAHKDSTGNAKSLAPGWIQRMSAGSGIRHSEFNPSPTDPLRLLQIWITPDRKNIRPSYEDREFKDADLRDRLALLAGPDGSGAPTLIHQDAFFYASRLSAGKAAAHPLHPDRHAFLHLAKGSITLNGHDLSEGDGVFIGDETEVAITAGDAGAEFILIEMA
ncbi:MAG: pirin family protein [Phycisphaeraceae bacterium]|nr:MAG: pirin family protein [Phycisphaeraceae bacterium]